MINNKLSDYLVNSFFSVFLYLFQCVPLIFGEDIYVVSFK